MHFRYSCGATESNLRRYRANRTSQDPLDFRPRAFCSFAATPSVFFCRFTTCATSVGRILCCCLSALRQHWPRAGPATRAWPAYQAHNAGASQPDWPRLPRPPDPVVLTGSAVWGQKLAALLNRAVPAKGVTQGTLEPEVVSMAMPRHQNGGLCTYQGTRFRVAAKQSRARLPI